MKLSGQKPFKATVVLNGTYECYALSGGRLSPRLALNFKVVGAGLPLPRAVVRQMPSNRA